MILDAVRGFFAPSSKEDAQFGIIMGIAFMFIGAIFMPWVLNIAFTVAGAFGLINGIVWAVSNPEPTE